MYLGFILMARGAFAESRRHLVEALRLAPGNPEAYVQLGVLTAREGHDGEAERLFRGAIEVAPDYAAGNDALARRIEAALAGRDGASP